MRRADFIKTCDASPLQRVPKSDRFQRSIPLRDAIEAHNVEARNGIMGVSKTRSARAVRLSGAPPATLRQASRSPLPPVQSRRAALAGKTVASANVARAKPAQIFAVCRAVAGWRVASETFCWTRSSSRSQLAMLMQLSEQRTAKENAAIANGPVIGSRGNRATTVPVAKRTPMA